MKNILQTIFSVKNENLHKIIKILGIKFKFKNKRKEQEILLRNVITMQNSISTQIQETKNNLKIFKNKVMERIVASDRYIHNIRKLSNETFILPHKFYDYLDSDIFNDYMNLIKGLDKESVLNVQKVINRIKQFKETGNDFYRLCDTEMAEYRNYISNYLDCVVQLNDETWAFNKYLLPSSLFDISVFYFRHHIDKFKSIDFSKSIIDAGASMGDSALFFSEYAKSNIYSFEPTKDLMKLIKKTIELNNLTNVVPVQMGLLDKDTEQNIYIAGCSGQSTTINDFRKDENNAEFVKFTTIDKFVKNNNIQVGLIKADVEGAEIQLLRGAIETIKTQKPALIISIYHGAEDFFKIKPMIESLNLGYSFKITKPALSNIVVETCLLAEVPKE